MSMTAAALVRGSGQVSRRNVFTNPRTKAFPSHGATRADVVAAALAGLAGGGDLLQANATNANGSYAYQAAAPVMPAESAMCYSEVVRRGNVDWIVLSTNVGADFRFVWFNIATGAIGGSFGQGSDVGLLGSGIADLGGGLYRPYIAISSRHAVAVACRLHVCDGNNTVASTTGQNVYCFHEQLEAGLIPTNPLG